MSLAGTKGGFLNQKVKSLQNGINIVVTYELAPRACAIVHLRTTVRIYR